MLVGNLVNLIGYIKWPIMSHYLISITLISITLGTIQSTLKIHLWEDYYISVVAYITIMFINNLWGEYIESSVHINSSSCPSKECHYHFMSFMWMNAFYCYLPVAAIVAAEIVWLYHRPLLTMASDITSAYTSRN